MSKEEKNFFKTCFNIVAGLEVKNESQAIAKEVVLSEVENLQNNWNELKKYCKNNYYGTTTVGVLERMQELEGKNE